GAHDLKLSASTVDAMTTFAKNGATSTGSSGVAVTPDVAISLSNVDTEATVGFSLLLTISGSLDAKATQTSSVSTTAEGAAKGDVSVGAALALTIASHKANSTTNRDISAGGDVSFQALGSSSTLSASVASAVGALGQ